MRILERPRLIGATSVAISMRRRSRFENLIHRPWFANRLLCTELAINDALTEAGGGSTSYFDTAEVS
jgi:hypothetical protein